MSNTLTLIQCNEDIKIIMDDKEYIVTAYWWEDTDFYFQTTDNKEFCCRNTYPISMKFDCLESINNESITLVGNNKLWSNNEKET